MNRIFNKIIEIIKYLKFKINLNSKVFNLYNRKIIMFIIFAINNFIVKMYPDDVKNVLVYSFCFVKFLPLIYNFIMYKWTNTHQFQYFLIFFYFPVFVKNISMFDVCLNELEFICSSCKCTLATISKCIRILFKFVEFNE